MLGCDDTESSLKEKMFSRKELQQYLSAKNLETYKPNLSTYVLLPIMLYIECLNIEKYGDFNLKIGFPSTQEIAAGASFFQMIDVEEPYSIIFCGFSTTNYDI